MRRAATVVLNVVDDIYKDINEAASVKFLCSYDDLDFPDLLESLSGSDISEDSD